jgi:hypothetical protein
MWTRAWAETCEMKVPLSALKLQAPREHINNNSAYDRTFLVLDFLTVCGPIIMVWTNIVLGGGGGVTISSDHGRMY